VRYFSLLVIGVASIALTACETAKGTAKDIQIVGENIGAVATGGEVPAFDENGNPQFTVGRMPEGYNYDDNPSDMDHLRAASHNQRVDLYHPNTGERAGPNAYSDMTMPNYSGGINTSDSSVTIYPLNQEMRDVFQGNLPQYNNTQYTGPQDFAPMAPDMTMGGNASSQIYFRHGSSRLGGGDIRKLSAVAKNTSGPITVEGYASKPTQAGRQSVQSSILNLKESMNRSFAVSKTLMKKGVPAENIKTVSYGSARATGSSSQDRRVDIVTGY